MNKLISLFALFTLSFSILFLSKTSPAQWELSSNGISGSVNIKCLTVSGSILLAGSQGEGIYVSSNNGASWTTSNSGLTQLSVYAIEVAGSTVYAGTFNGLFKSTNNGATWVSSGNGTEGSNIFDFAVAGSVVYAAGNGGLYRSGDNGANWGKLTNGLPTGFAPVAVVITGSGIIAAQNVDGPTSIYRSTNGGDNWILSETGLGNGHVNCLSASGSIVLAGTSAGAYVSTNDGVNWGPANGGLSSLFYTNTLLAYDGKFFLGTNPSGGLFMTTNNGTNWLDKNLGFTGPQYVYSIIVSNNYIFAAKYHSVWKRAYSQIIGIRTISSEVPEAFSLKQNYPNPFNPYTDIEFRVHNSSVVTLKVFDDKGTEVGSPVNEFLTAGTYRVRFDAGSLGSGVYFYTLKAFGFIETKKMLLIK